MVKLEQKLDQLMKLKDRENFIDELGTLAAELLEANHPFVPDLIEHIKKHPNSVLQVQLKVFNGKVQQMVTTEMTKRTYK